MRQINIQLVSQANQVHKNIRKLFTYCFQFFVGQIEALLLSQPLKMFSQFSCLNNQGR